MRAINFRALFRTSEINTICHYRTEIFTRPNSISRKIWHTENFFLLVWNQCAISHKKWKTRILLWLFCDFTENSMILAFHSVEKREIISHQINTSWNQLFSNVFSEEVDFTKFLQKRENFCNFHTVLLKRKAKYYVKSNDLPILSKLPHWFHEKLVNHF